jgi:hypothetical protein
VSDHPTKGHTIAGIIMVLIIAALATWGFSLMNDGNVAAASVAGVLLFGIGTYAVLGMGRARA